MVVGLGKRGGNHVTHFEAHPDFRVTAICDIRRDAIEAAAKDLSGPITGTDAREVALAARPDVFCFCTLPDIRKEMIGIAIEAGAKLIAFEKPVALTTTEGQKIKVMIEDSGIKAVLSYQHRYGPHYQKVAEIIHSGAIGDIHTIYATAVGWPAHMAEHMLHYTRWFAGDPIPQWVMANAAGECKLTSPNKHYSPDYLGAFVQYKGGIRGIYEIGGGAPDVPQVSKWFHKNRIGAMGTGGYAEVYTGGGYRAVTTGGVLEGPGAMDYDQDMPGYIADIAKWLNEGIEHPCSFSNAYTNFSIWQGMYRSYFDGGQVRLPLEEVMDELAELRKKMAGSRVIVTFDESLDEYGC